MKSTSEVTRNGNKPRRRDVIAMGAALAHKDADGSSAVMAARMGRTDRTARRWKSDGTGGPVDQHDHYLLSVEHPFRVVAHVKTIAKIRAVINRPAKELIARFHEILLAEKGREAVDTSNDLRRGLTMLARAQAAESDAALDEEKAAICYECAARGITESQLFGGTR